MISDIEWDVESCAHIRVKDLESIEEIRKKAYNNVTSYYEQVMKTCNKAMQH